MSLALALAACGGGGGDSGSNTAQPQGTQGPALPIEQFALVVNTSGSGSGQVASVSDAGLINCTNDAGSCAASYDSGTEVTLRAQATTGSTFAGWSGSGINCPGTGDCVVTMSQARAVDATFSVVTPQYQLEVVVAGSGTVTSNPSGINCPTACTDFIDADTNVTLTALPAAGYDFAGWSVSGVTCSASSTTCVVPMSTARSVTATFTPQAVTMETLNVSISGSGGVASNPAGISCGGTCTASFAHGTPVTLAASPVAGYRFTGWSGACTGNGSCTVPMTGATAVAATFTVIPPNTYALNVAVAGSGTVTSNPAGISCGADCSEIYNEGTSITLTAAPASGYSFTGWSGACAGSASTCTVSMSAATTVGATFTRITYALAVSKVGSGTVTSSPAGINCGATCSASINSGTSVTLTATPSSGYAFSGWSGGGCSGTGTCTVTVNAATNVTATFTLVTYNLSVAVSGSGSVGSSPSGITCGSTCSATFAQNTTVTLAATPASGYSFTGWTGACTGTGSCVVSMSAAKSVTATFTVIPPTTYALNTTVGGSGTITSSPAGINCGSSCSATFNQGTSVVLTASPSSGYQLSGWTGGGCTGSASTCTVTMNAAATVTATFVPIPYTLTISKTGSGTVTSSPTGLSCGSTCSASFNAGTSITLSATPSASYSFTGWSGGGCSGTGTCTVTMSAATTVSATFTLNTYAVSITKAGAGSGTVTSSTGGISCGATCSGSVNAGTSVTLTAAAGSGSAFTGWSGGGCTGTGTCTVTVNAATAVTATFVPTYALTVSKAGAGSGTVTSSVGGISCGATCSATVNSGTSVTLTAAASGGSAFTGWSGGGCSGTGTCTVTMSAATAVTATFTPTYTLTVSKAGAGSGTVTSSVGGISCGSTCAATVNSGTSVTLTAAAGSGSAFSGWSGGGCSGTGTCTVAVSAATTVTATFAPSTYTLSVSGSPSAGTVTSSPAGISCGSTCSAAFSTGSSVTLTAAAASGYTFSGWTGACSGTGTCTVTMSAANSVGATFTATAAPTSGSPVVLYTDTLTGPTTGGENNLGGYLSIFGKNFGSASGLGTTTKVYIGGVEVANYRYLGNAKVGSKLGLQQITVQVGALGGAANGTALPVTVSVSGVSSNTNLTFTPASGRILFVSLTGSDSTAVPGNIAKPYRNLQAVYSSTGSVLGTFTGAYFNLQAGDHIVIRGGNWSDVNGLNRTWMQACPGSYAKNGTASAWIHVTAYPGPINGNAIEDVHYTTPGGDFPGGISGPENAASGTSGEYWSISNLRMEVAGGSARDAAPINFQFTAGPWRVVNNELGPWVAGNSAILNAAAVSGHGNGNKILGNHIHDIQGILTGDQALQNHGIYSDSMSLNWEIAYNWMHDMVGGSLIQFNDNQGCAGEPVSTSMCGAMPHTGGVWAGFTGMRVHHNWLENAAKYGINYNDQGVTQKGTFEGQHWNNVIIGTSLPPIRINSTQPTQQLNFAFNTLYNNMKTLSGTGNGYVRNEGFGTGAGIHNTFYDNIFVIGANTTAGTEWFMDSGGTSATTTTYDFKRNLYYGGTQSPAAASTIGDNLAITGNPLFANAAAGDFTLQASSPAINQASKALVSGFTVGDDFSSLAARTVGGTPDLGAFEYNP